MHLLRSHLCWSAEAKFNLQVNLYQSRVASAEGGESGVKQGEVRAVGSPGLGRGWNQPLALMPDPNPLPSRLALHQTARICASNFDGADPSSRIAVPGHYSGHYSG